MLEFLNSVLGLQSHLYTLEQKRVLKGASLYDINRIFLGLTSEKDEYLLYKAITFRLGDLIAGTDPFGDMAARFNVETEEISKEIDHAIEKDKKFKSDSDVNTYLVYDYLNQAVCYFFDLMFLFRCQTYLLTSERDENLFKLQIIKNVIIPQFLLTLYSDVPNKKLINLAFTASEMDDEDKFKRTCSDKIIFFHSPIFDFLPNYSPLKYLHEVIRRGNAHQGNFMAACRQWIKEILIPISEYDCYQNFVDHFLNKLTPKKIRLLETIQAVLQNLESELPREGAADYLDLFDKTMGVLNCFSILERIKRDLKIDNEWLPEILETADSILNKAKTKQEQYLGRSPNKDNNEVAESLKITQLIDFNYQFIDGWQFKHADTEEDSNTLHSTHPKHRHYLGQRSRQLFELLTAIPITREYFFPSKIASFKGIAYINYILNNIPKPVYDYTKQASSDNYQNKTKLIVREPFVPPPPSTPIPDFPVDVILPDCSDWETIAHQEICNVLAVSCSNHENSNNALYLTINLFNQCLINLLNNDKAQASMNIEFALKQILRHQYSLPLGMYVEYILSFYLGLKAYGSRPNFPSLRKMLLWINPLTNLPSPNILAKKNTQYDFFFILVIRHFNYFCIKKNRLLNLANNPYMPVFAPLEQFLLFATEQNQHICFNQLDIAWNKLVTKSHKTICKKKLLSTEINIVNILQNHQTHLKLFTDLYLDGHRDAEFIFMLLSEDHVHFYLNDFIVQKLNDN